MLSLPQKNIIGRAGLSNMILGSRTRYSRLRQTSCWRVCLEDRYVTEFIITVLESGPWGGLALSGNDFGLAIDPFALSTIPDVFSNFQGGIIDAASLGFLQVDSKGNVNPCSLPDRIFGPGGFPVIAGGVPRIYFAGTFTAGQSEISMSHNRIAILRYGKIPKLVESVFKVVFSGQQAIKYGQEILYVTERAVFRLTESGIILEEDSWDRRR